jgi:hypothetical protein
MPHHKEKAIPQNSEVLDGVSNPLREFVLGKKLNDGV